MVYDRLENLGRYSLDLKFISDSMQSVPFGNGKFEIERERVFGIDLEYVTSGAEEGVWEAHRKYIDIHVLFYGEELIYVSDIESMRPENDYVDDYQFFLGKKEHVIHFRPGSFLILFPNEVHKTSIFVNDREMVRKRVFKLLV